MLQSSTRSVGVTMFRVWARTHAHTHTHTHTHQCQHQNYYKYDYLLINDNSPCQYKNQNRNSKNKIGFDKIQMLVSVKNSTDLFIDGINNGVNELFTDDFLH